MALIGLVVNLGSLLMITTMDRLTSFNMMLMIVGIIDIIHLFCSILESLRKNFAFELHVVIFPKILHPLVAIAITASVFLNIALVKERYDAVNQPVTYRQV